MLRMLSRMLGIPCLVLLLLAAAGCGAGAEETGNWVSIDEYRLYFDGETSAGLQWRTAEDTPQPDAVFYIPLREGVEVPVFTMTLMEDQGDYATVLTDPQGNPVPVSFVLAERPSGLTEDERWNFAWAQVDVYVLMETLVLKDVENLQARTSPMRVVTDGYELVYDARWRNQIRVVPGEDGDVDFLVVINGKCYRLFTVVYDNSAGDMVVSRMDPRGIRKNVSFYMAAAPQELSAQERKAFYSAQGLVDEVAGSILLR